MISHVANKFVAPRKRMRAINVKSRLLSMKKRVVARVSSLYLQYFRQLRCRSSFFFNTSPHFDTQLYYCLSSPIVPRSYNPPFPASDSNVLSIIYQVLCPFVRRCSTPFVFTPLACTFLFIVINYSIDNSESCGPIVPCTIFTTARVIKMN